MSYHLIRFFFFRRKVQEALEKENKENFKKRDEEKRKVDEATEKAKELMRVRKEGRKGCYDFALCSEMFGTSSRSAVCECCAQKRGN